MEQSLMAEAEKIDDANDVYGDALKKIEREISK